MYRPISLVLLALALTLLCACKVQVEEHIENWKQLQLSKIASTPIEIAEWHDFDFSSVWLGSRPHQVHLGGEWENHSKFSIYEIEKISTVEYIVAGAISRNYKEVDFTGRFFVEDIHEFQEFDLGTNNWMKEKIKKQGVTVANFSLYTADLKDNEVFRGLIISRWYVNWENQLLHDNIRDDSEAYANNQFVGAWMNYEGDDSSANWRHHWVPNCAEPVDELLYEGPEVVSLSVYSTIEEAEAAMAAAEAEEASKRRSPQDDRTIPILGGIAMLEMSKGHEFPCIGIHFSDRNTRTSMGTYIEIKRKGGLYITEIQFEYKKFRTLEEAIEASLKEEIFADYYEEKDKEYGEKVWAAFVEEGGLQKFIETAKEYIDDEFLNSPFNETYG